MDADTLDIIADTGDDIEQKVAQWFPELFNSEARSSSTIGDRFDQESNNLVRAIIHYALFFILCIKTAYLSLMYQSKFSTSTGLHYNIAIAHEFHAQRFYIIINFENVTCHILNFSYLLK